MKDTQTILIVEDEPPILKILRDRLMLEGYGVLQANNGQEGLDTALAKHPDLIMMDIKLPDIDGLNVLQKIRADSWGLTAKVIMLTNLSDNQSVLDAMSLGSPDFLVKSDWKIEDVIQVIRDRLKS